MTIEFISPIMRLVQGNLSLEVKTDPTTGKPKLDDTGQQIKECFIAVAIRKDDPALPAFYALFQATAKAEFPHLFDAAGNCTHPRFAMKWQDGDGVDNSGKSVATKPGFANHWVVRMGTRYMPKCFHAGKYDPSQQIQNPKEIIKRGYFVRVAGTLRGNGVTTNERQAIPGLFVSPNLVELVAFGEEIVGGADAAKVFGGSPVATSLPPGASSTPVGGGLSAPPLPGASMFVGGPAMPIASHIPPVPPAPSYQMTASANGATREQLIAQNWTDALLLEHGHMVRV